MLRCALRRGRRCPEIRQLAYCIQNAIISFVVKGKRSAWGTCQMVLVRELVVVGVGCAPAIFSAEPTFHQHASRYGSDACIDRDPRTHAIMQMMR